MTIKKYAHACLLVDVDGVRFLIDPGTWNDLPDADGIDAILVTHEHQDHCDIAQIKTLMVRNPDAPVITHAAVNEKLEAEGITNVIVIEPGTPIEVNGVSIESFGTEHAAIYQTSPCRNTGFLINGELFIPGDAVHDVPTTPVRLLALPTGGPWMKIAEAIEYAKAVKPTIAFPIHDAMYIEGYQRALVPGIVGAHLTDAGIEFIDMPNGTTREY